MVLIPGTALGQEAGSKTPTIAAVIPPQPRIIKKSADAISIPSGAVSSIEKYQTQPTASASATIGSRFGYRRDPFTRRSRFHSGLDIKAAAGEPIAASLSGTVQYAGWYHGYGNWVIVDHGGGVTTHYAHLSVFAVEDGQKVERGTLVGYAGRTGRATSPHLHYELRVDNTPVNPLEPLALSESSEFFKQPKQPATNKSPQPATAEPVRTPQSVNQEKQQVPESVEGRTSLLKTAIKRINCKI
jgi:murein DD-endopeptidase MepM/ murein hydrolase activator NlpD